VLQFLQTLQTKAKRVLTLDANGLHNTNIITSLYIIVIYLTQSDISECRSNRYFPILYDVILKANKCI